MKVYNEDDEDLQSEFIRSLHPATKLLIVVFFVLITIAAYLIIK